MTTYFSQPLGFNLFSGSFHKPCSPLSSGRGSGKFLREHSPKRKNWHSMARLCNAILMSGLITGCITDATVDLTKAPFDATTALTDGTSQATTDLTEPTREFLSSTTPGAWFQADGTLNPDHKRTAFVVLNFDNLQEDMAHGNGEYLVSLARLVGVPPHSRDSFLKSAQSQYGYIFEEGQSRPESLRRLISTLHINSYSS